MILSQMLPIVSVSMIVSALAYLVTPDVGRKLKEMKIVGIDVHKARRPRIPEMGGVVILIPLLFLLSSAFVLMGSVNILYVLASTAFFGAYGILDDVKQLGKYQKLAISAAMGTVLLAPLNLPLLIIPVILVVMAGIGNIFNLFAGFNGLEVGCGMFTAFFFSILCLMTGNTIPFYLSIGMFLLLLAFLLHNKYPARIFPGNVGTFTVGGFFAGICIYYDLTYLLLPLLSLHLADIVLKGASAGYFSSSEMKRTKVNGDNILVPRSDYLSLARLVLRIRPMDEKHLVYFFWGLSILIGTITVAVTGVLL